MCVSAAVCGSGLYAAAVPAAAAAVPANAATKAVTKTAATKNAATKSIAKAVTKAPPARLVPVTHPKRPAPAALHNTHSKDKGAGKPAKVTMTVHYGARRATTGAHAALGDAVPAANPTTPFTECPAVGADTSCQILINVTSSQYQILADGSQGPFDGSDDSLIGILNSSNQPVTSITLSSSTGIFGFDGDGVCQGYNPGPAGCPFGSTGYEGPGTSFTGMSADGGTVDFAGGLAPGASAYFSLEQALDATTVFAGGPTAGEQGGAPNPSEHRTTCFTQLPVNCATGAFTHTLPEISVPGRGVPLNFSLSYDSTAAAQGGPVGNGWTDPYSMSLALDGSGDATVTQEDGATVSFVPNGSGGFVAPPRVLGTLVANADGTYTFTRKPSQDAYVFSATGQLVSEHDRNGYLTSLTYTGNLLTSVTDSAGRSLTFGYTGSQITSVTDPLGRKVTLAYDASGNLTGVTDRAGRTTSLTYDSGSQLLTMTDPRGGVITNVYDSSGRVVKQTDPAGLVSTWSYSGDPSSQSGSTTTMTDGHGDVTQYVYQTFELQSVTHGYGTPAAATTTYAYDPATLGVASVTDPNGNVSTSVYDADGNTLQTTDPLGNYTYYQYDSLDDVTLLQTPAYESTYYYYDGNGNLTETYDPTGATTYYTYGDSGNPGDITSITDPDNRVRNLTYDAYGDLASSTVSPDGTTMQTTAYVYDADGEQTCMASADATASGITCPAAGQPAVPGTTSTTYDADSEITATTNAVGSTTAYAYDADGNRTTITDPTGNKTVSTYDNDDRVTSVTNGYGSSSASTTSTAYDVHPGQGSCPSGVTGEVYCEAKTDANGHITVDSYNARGLVVQERTPVQTAVYTYDAAGKRTAVTDGAGRTTTSAYDSANRLTSVAYSDGTTPGTSFTYDADGRRVSMTDGTGTSVFNWDADSHLLGATDGANNSVSYGYDAAGEQTSITYPGAQTVTRSYDGAGRLSSVTDWASRVTSFAYDGNGNLTSTAYPNGDTVASSYDAANQQTGTSVAPTATPASPLAAIGYTLNPDGLIAKETDSGALTGSTAYTYNANSQLSAVNGSAYGYNSGGDPTKLSGSTSQTFNAADEVTSTSTSSSSTSYGYDAVGDRTRSVLNTGTTTAYSYDQANRLTSLTQGSTFTSLTPARLADTRPGSGKPYAGQTLTAGGTLSIQVAGKGGVPASGATAVVVNLVAATATASTYLTVYPTGTTRPVASSVDAVPGTVTNNQVTARLGGNGQLTIFNNGGSTNVVVDVLGYYGAAGSSFTAIKPVRITDTRFGSGQPNAGHPLAASGTLNVQVTGANGDGVPANATGVTVETTVVTPTMSGYLTAYPSGIAVPATSNVDYPATVNTTREITVKLGTSPAGAISYFNGSKGKVNIVVDVVGYYAPTGQSFNPMSPYRLVDTRAGSGKGDAGKTLAAGTSLTITATGQAGVPATATGVVLNLIVPSGPASGYVNVYPAGTTKPVSTNVTFQSGSIAFDEVTVALGSGGAFTVTNNSSGKADVVVDLAGYFAPATVGSYTYDATGLRVAKTTGSGTEQYVWNRSSEQPQPLVDGSLLFVDGPNGTPIEQVDGNGSGNASYLVPDALGSTRLLLNSTGAVSATYSYTAFGSPTTTTTTGTSSGTGTTPIRYAGAYYDTESGLLYLINRYYDPTSAQFLSVDPLAALTGSSYLYTDDNPINGTDPNGMMCWSFHCLANDASNISNIATTVDEWSVGVVAASIVVGTAALVLGAPAIAAGAATVGGYALYTALVSDKVASISEDVSIGFSCAGREAECGEGLASKALSKGLEIDVPEGHLIAKAFSNIANSISGDLVKDAVKKTFDAAHEALSVRC